MSEVKFSADTEVKVDPFLHSFKTNSKVICVDMDEVLLQMRSFLVERHLKIHGVARSLEDFQWFNWVACANWGASRKEFLELRDSLLPISDQDWAEYKPVEGAKEGLESLKAMGYRLVLVTHRSIEQEGVEEQLKLWIHRQYPGIFDAKDLIFAGGRERVPPIRRATPKHKICRELGARFLIDDCIETALQCSEVSPQVPAVIFGAYPWNRFAYCGSEEDKAWAAKKRAERDYWDGEHVGQDLPEGVKRARDWKEVVALVEEVEKKLR